MLRKTAARGGHFGFPREPESAGHDRIHVLRRNGSYRASPELMRGQIAVRISTGRRCERRDLRADRNRSFGFALRERSAEIAKLVKLHAFADQIALRVLGE